MRVVMVASVGVFGLMSFQACRSMQSTSGASGTGGSQVPPVDGTVPPAGYRLVPVPAAGGLPMDALPEDVSPTTGRVLMSSYTKGLFEVDWPEGASAPTVARQWPRETIGIVGQARYAGDAIYVNISARGLAKIVGQNVSVLGQADGLINNELLTMLVRANGELWVAGVPSPAGGGGVQIVVADKPGRIMDLGSTDMQTLRDWIEMPERGSVFAATKAGVAELKSDGAPFVVNRNAVVAIARQPAGGEIVAAGDYVERWNGTNFSLIGGHRPAPAGGGVSSGPVDVVIESDGAWVVLYADGYLSVLDPSGHYLLGFNNATGVPTMARQLLLLAGGGRVVVAGPQGAALLLK